MAGRGSAIEQARDHYRRRSWSQAFDSFAAADRAAALGAEDLERLSTSAYLTGRDEEYLHALERAHAAHLRAGAVRRGARCAFWMALGLLLRGQAGRAAGWLARAARLLASEDEGCAERGYLLLPVAERELDAGDCRAAYATASAAEQIGERCNEPDLTACARHLRGRALIRAGRVAAGLALLDETMVAVAVGDLSPVMAGLMYCSVIDACRQVFAVDRAREWTLALFQWCGQQPQMVAFTGTCLVHRAELMCLQGAWQDAIGEARQAAERCLAAANERAAGAACYQTGEVLRLRGDFDGAERAYADASRRGCEPQPGLALLRLAQGRTEAALTAARRILQVTHAPLERLVFLPAYVEIAIAAGEVAAASDACRELERIAAEAAAEAAGAIAAEARAAVELAGGDACAALQSARRAWNEWQRIGAPYRAARARVLVGRACDTLGDRDGALLELDAARAVFARLGASPDLTQLDALRHSMPRRRGPGLTRRELQILRLLAAGETNRGIATELSLSERTIDRHVSNIFAKLDVPSRTAAAAYAFRHHIV